MKERALPKSSSKISKKILKVPAFKSEAEEADWYHSPEGRRVMDQHARNAKPVRKQFNVQPTDPAILEALAERVKAKQGPQTTAISLRVDKEDLAKAKAVAERTSVGHQALLKEIIHEALMKALA